MKNYRRKFELYCHKNRGRGIQNLMLYICLGNGVVTFLTMMNGGSFLYELLRFDKSAILHGQVWRLVSWLLTEQLSGNPLLSVLFLYFFYRLGNAVEASIGTFKFNLFYLSGVVLMDIFALFTCPTEAATLGNLVIPAEVFTAFYSNMAYYLHLSMVLAFSTMYPDSQFYLFFMIPVRAWLLALVDLILIAIDVFNMCYPVMLFPHCLFPLIGLLNYFLFFGPDMGNLLPLSWRVKLRRRSAKKSSGPKVIPFDAGTRQGSSANAKASYTHRCTICGRTDVDSPQLEFRYCSRCQGYHCYCQDHIQNHTHIQ